MELIDVILDEKTALKFMENFRFENGVPICDRCGSGEVYGMKWRAVYKCRHCKKQFSIKVGTIMADSSVPIRKWLLITWLMANERAGCTSYSVAKKVNIHQGSSWAIMLKIRSVM